MPFNSETGAEAGRKYGKKASEARWGERDRASVRSVRLSICVSPDEMEMIKKKVAVAKISRAEFIIRAVRAFDV